MTVHSHANRLAAIYGKSFQRLQANRRAGTRYASKQEAIIQEDASRASCILLQAMTLISALGNCRVRRHGPS